MPIARRIRRHAVLLLLISGALAACGEPAAHEQPAELRLALSAADCPAGYRVIQGTSGPDTLSGNGGSDCILGLGGNDVINGNGGNDFIVGGDGDDRVSGGGGDDTVHGEAGHDLLHGDNGNDVLYGNDGDDVLDGDANSDTLWGGNGDDVLYGDAANDKLNGEAGDDALLGGAGTNVINGGAGTDACSGTACEKPALSITGCTQNSQCAAGARCISDFGLCIGCVSDVDGDGTCDSKDGCPTDGAKSAPGVCGCGVSDVDGDGDGAPTCLDGCPTDPAKQSAGACGCGASDADGDADGTADCVDGCPTDPAKLGAGTCGCGVSDVDSDGDGTANCQDACPSDPAKLSAGTCGCGVSDADSDGDGTANCQDGCPNDPAKLAAGLCGCGVSDADSDGDAAPDCLDGCPLDAAKSGGGVCGCGVADSDTDADGRADCVDLCPGADDTLDANANGTPDGCEVPTDCTANTVGIGVHRGDAYISSDQDLAVLEGVTCVTGWVVIYGASTLSALSSLTHIAGGLAIFGNQELVDLEGLENLEQIGATLAIDANPALRSIEALGSLVSLGDQPLPGYVPLRVAFNQALPPCQVWALQARTGQRCDDGSGGCAGNAGSGSCGELPPDFACVPGAVGPGVYDGDVVLSEGSSSAYAGVTCITGGLWIAYDVSSLATLSHLQKIGGSLNVANNAQLTDLAGLEQLSEVGGMLWINGNVLLRDLSALASLQHLGTRLPPEASPLDIRFNLALPACQAWAMATQTHTSCASPGWFYPDLCAHNTGTGSCGTLPPDFACVPGAVGPGVYDGYLISYYHGSALDDLGGVTCITGDVSLEHVTDLSKLRTLQQVGGALSLLYNEELTDLRGLENLTSVGAWLQISSHARLVTLAGLERLRRIGGQTSVFYNDQLRDVSALAGLESVGATLPPSWARLSIWGNYALPGCQVWAIDARTGHGCYRMAGSASVNDCIGNLGTDSCGTLPADFACVPGAQGPGVFDGDLALQFYGGVTHWGGLTCVTGDLSISTPVLSIYSTLQKVGGDLNITSNPSLTSLAGLENLTDVGRHLRITGTSLQDLAGLSGLRHVGARLTDDTPSLEIRDNEQLAPCHVLSLQAQSDGSCERRVPGYYTYTCYGNNGTQGCGALPADFACVPGASGPGVHDGSISVWNAETARLYAGVTCVTGDVTLETALEDLAPFSSLQKIGGDLLVRNTYGLTNVDALVQLTEVGGRLRIQNNQSLSNLSGLSKLTALGARYPGESVIAIQWNAQLAPCWVVQLEAQTGSSCSYECGSNAGSGRCGDLPVDFACVPGARGPGVYDGDAVDWDSSKYRGLTCITGDLVVPPYNPYFSPDLTAFEHLQKLGGSLRMQSTSYPNVDGLENLTEIGGQLAITYNASLLDLDGLSSLTSLGARNPPDQPALLVLNNPQLPACWVAALETQTGISCGMVDYQQCWDNSGEGSCPP